MPAKVKVYNKNGKSAEMFSIDASDAVRNHPDEWSFTPFPSKAEAEAKAKAEAEAKAKAEAEAKK